jgi:hypothetical protein
MHEGYHDHQYSPENQEAALDFLDHFNGMPRRRGLPAVKELDDQTLQCTRSGQVMLDFPDARSLMDVIRDYYREHRGQPGRDLKQSYYSGSYAGINSWHVSQYDGGISAQGELRWEPEGSSLWDGISIDRYVLHHSRYLRMPLLWFHRRDGASHSVLFWLGENGKATARDWPEIVRYIDSGYDVVSIDPRGLGETRMPYKAISTDDPALAQLHFDHAYVNPLSGVLADYVYNSLLTGRPYFLQMIEDVEIAARFVKEKFAASEFAITGAGDAYTVARAASEVLPNVKLLAEPHAQILSWSELVEQERELWPIQDLLPGGAYVH